MNDLQAEYDAINQQIKALRERQDELDLAMTKLEMEQRNKRVPFVIMDRIK